MNSLTILVYQKTLKKRFQNNFKGSKVFGSPSMFLFEIKIDNRTKVLLCL